MIMLQEREHNPTLASCQAVACRSTPLRDLTSDGDAQSICFCLDAEQLLLSHQCSPLLSSQHAPQLLKRNKSLHLSDTLCSLVPFSSSSSASRRRLLEGLDLVSTTLGLLINLAEQDKACQPILAGLSLPHGKVVVPLLCRLMQVRRC